MKYATIIAIVSLCLFVGCTKRSSDGNVDVSSQAPSVTPAAASDGQQAPVATQVAILAGGCFWGMEEILRQVPGVIETDVGYTGGTVSNPDYDDVKGGDSGHAEAVRVVYDPTKLSYAELLEKWFFRMHDPTTKDRQGNDRGSQYRSAIFATTPEQKRIAHDVKRRMNAAGRWPHPIVTEIVDAGSFTLAEDFHQDYLQANPGGYTCHYLRDWSEI